MQDFYGNKPFVMGQNSKKPNKRESQTLGVRKSFVVTMTLLFVAAICLAAYFFYGTAYSANIPGKTYYAVCFYDGQIKSIAEDISSELMAGGGSGYLISDGTYRVFGSIYSDISSAESVAQKQELDCDVVEVGWQAIKIKSEEYGTAQEIARSLDYFERLVDDLVLMALKFDSEAISRSTMETYLGAAKEKFSEYRANALDKRVAAFFEKCVNSIENNLVSDEQKPFSSSFKYIIHDFVQLRSTLTF